MIGNLAPITSQFRSSARPRCMLCAAAVAAISLLGAVMASAEPNAQEPPGVDKPQEASAEISAPIDGKTPAKRGAAFLAYLATAKPKQPDYPKEAMHFYIARLLLNKDTEYALSGWRAAAEKAYSKAIAGIDDNPLDDNALNPFDKIALFHGWLVCRDKVAFPDDIVSTMKKYVALSHHKVWKGYGALNYRLMKDGTGFLAAEQWPDLVDADGLNADQIKAATKVRLMGYFDEIVHQNNDEYGSPTYLGVDLCAMRMLAGYAVDPEVKKHASMALDAMLLQVACAYNHGYYVTPAARAKYFGSSFTSPDDPDTTSTIAWLLWGGDRPVNARATGPGASFWFAANDAYQPPALLAKIATDRSSPFTHHGAKGGEIRLTIYHTPTYSVASQWENEPGPTSGRFKECRRTMFKWVSDKPGSTFIPMQENILRPYKPKEVKPNAFGYGENPYCQCVQHEGTVIGVTNVPPDYPFWRLYAPFTTRGAIALRQEKNGWVFCHGGSVLFAFRYVKPSTWGKHRAKENVDVLGSDDRKNGWILDTSPADRYSGGGLSTELDRFAADVIAKTKIDDSQIDAAHPRLVYRSLSGHLLDLTYRDFKEPYTDQHKVDGVPVDYATFPLLGNPWVHQDVGGDLLTIIYGAQRLTYDFKAWRLH